MPIKVTCPKCGGVLHAPDDAGGKRGRCPTCGTVLNIPANAPQANLPEPAPGFSLRPGAGAADNPFGPTGGTAAAAALPPPPPSRPPFARGPAEPNPKKESSAPGTLTYNIADSFPPQSAPAAPPSCAGRTDNHPPLPTRANLGGTGEMRKAPSVPPMPVTPEVPTGAAVPEDAPRWRMVARGLGWVRSGTWFLMLAAIAPAGLALYEQFAGPLPLKAEGILKVTGLSGPDEVRLAAILIPAVLGVLLTVIGRLQVGGAPRAAFTGGTARLTALGTLIAFGGLIAAAVPAVMQVANQNSVPTGLAPAASPDGIAQRLGLAAAGGFGLVAELWFVVALGRIGAALQARTPAARSGRLLGLAGLALGLGVVGWVGYTVYPDEVNNWLAANVYPTWEKLAPPGQPDNKPAARAGAVILGALLAGAVCLRLTGSAKRAVRGWLEQVPAA